jgi:hypothetical protein
VNLRLVQFTLAAGQAQAAHDIADRVVPVIRKQPGCDRAEFFGEETSGEYGIAVFWSTRQAAEAAAPVISPILTPLLAAAQRTGETRRLFDVYEPRY